jgi:hypothetical protein
VGNHSITSRVADAVRDGGALFSTAFGLDDRLLVDERIRTANYRLDRKPERLAELTKLVMAGTIRPVIGAKLPLEETPRALVGGDLDPVSGRARLSYRRAAEIFNELTKPLTHPDITAPADLAAAPGWTLHDLRHSALTHAAENGANTGTLLAYSGHASVTRSTSKVASRLM